MAISTRTRFEIFKRDGFQCKYCGSTPMQSPLHVDHVNPKAEGGSDDPSNLITACRDCNLGKSKVPLEQRALRAQFTSEEERDQAEQIREYLRVQRDILDAKKDAEAIVLQHWQERIGEWHSSLPKNVPGAIRDFGVARMVEAVDIVARKQLSSPVEQVKYFCGVIRRMRSDTGAEHLPVDRRAALLPGSEVEAAAWRVTVDILQSYAGYRFSEWIPEDLSREIAQAIVPVKGTLDWRGWFRVVDAAAADIISCEDMTALHEKEQFHRYLGASEVPRTMLYTGDGYQRIIGGELSNIMMDHWARARGQERLAEPGMTWDADIKPIAKTLQDILPEIDFWSLADRITNICTETPLLREQHARLRLQQAIGYANAEAEGFPFLGDRSPIREWPEFIEAVIGLKDKG